MKISKRVWLFLLLFGTPLIFLYTLSKGKNNSEDLPYFSKEIIISEHTLNEKLTSKDSLKFKGVKSIFKNQKIKEFSFWDKDSIEVSSKSTQGRTLVVNTLIPSCPSSCPIILSQLQFLVYKKLKDYKEFKDLLFLSHLIDTTGAVPDLQRFVNEQEEINPDTWKIVIGNDNPIYDFEVPSGNIQKRICDGSVNCFGGKAYYQMILLVDRDRKIRGMYQGNQTQLIEKMRGDIRKLFSEYVKEDRKASK